MYLKNIFSSYGRRNFLELILLAVFVFFFFVPILNVIMMGFASDYKYPMLIPASFSLKWWRFVFGRGDLFKSIGLSFGIATLTTILSLIICLPAAYAFARFKFPLKKLFLFSFLLTDAFPKIGLYVSIGFLFYKFNLMGKLIGVMIIHTLNSLMFMTWIPANAFGSIHISQEESALDVGASPFRVFMNITLPLALPGIFVASTFTFLSSLEELQGTLLVGIPKYRTIPIQLYSAIQDYPTTAGPVFATILIIPCLLVLFLTRKYVTGKSLAAGVTMK